MEAAASIGPFSTSAIVESYAHPPEMPLGWRVALWAATRVSTAFDSRLAIELEDFSKRLVERALAMHALRERIEAEEWPTEEIDPDDVARRAFDVAIQSLEELRERLAARPSRSGSDVLIDAKRRCGESVQTIIEEIKILRGAIQAHDANVTAQQRAAQKPARTPEEIDQQLDAAFLV